MSMYFLDTRYSRGDLRLKKNDFRRENVSSHDNIFPLIYLKLEILLWI